MDNHQYSTAEILAYLRGDMPPADMYRLEKAALDDELLADALEGFSKMRERYSDEFILAKLEKNTTAVTPPKEEVVPVIALPRRKIPWERFMAAAVVVGILAIAINRFTDTEKHSKNSSEAGIATTQAPAEVNVLHDSTLPPQTDVAVMSPTEAPGNTALAEGKKVIAKKTATAAKKEPVALTDAAPEKGNIASIESVSTFDGYTADKSITPRTMTQPRTLAPASGRQQKGLAASTDTSKYLPQNGWQPLISGLQEIALPEGTLLEITIGEKGRINEMNITPFAAEKEKALLEKLLKTTEPWITPNKKTEKFVWMW